MNSRSGLAKAFEICGEEVEPGQRRLLSLDAANLYDFTEMKIPIEVVHGKKPGPVLFISSAIHGDEINGVEIIRRLLARSVLRHLRGTLLAIPVVNVFGFNNRSRYLPDRRDLNRSFPGNENGSLASRIAHSFMREVVSRSTHGIDIHTAAIHRANFTQVRAYLDDPATKDLAMAFGAPIVLNSKLRDGSLREAARDRKIPILLYEAGEALRYDSKSIKVGVLGCLSVMHKIGMLEQSSLARPKPVIAQDSVWVRAPNSGSVRVMTRLGKQVRKEQTLATIHDLFGKTRIEVKSPEDGIIIGEGKLPLVNKGDALFHLATFKNMGRASSQLEAFDSDMAV